MIAYELETRIEYKGKTYDLNLAFDNVLRIFDMQKEELFTEEEKLQYSMDMLITQATKSLSTNEKVELLNLVINTFVSTGNKSKKSEKRLFDFNQDASYIYAAFKMDYGIDLVEEQGKLDWRKFIALFQGLSERTKIREIMSIRSRDIPKPNKHNAEEIKNLHEMKAYYALKLTDEEREISFQKGLDALAGTLEKMAVKKGR